MPVRPSRLSPLRPSRLAPLVVACAAAWGSPARADTRAETKLACSAAADHGQSQRDDGAYRAARASFARCAQDDCPRIVARACGDWLREVDASMPTLVLGAKDPRGADVSDVQVALDGAPFATPLDGHPVAADPGSHSLRFTRRDGAVVEERVTLRVGEKNRLVVVTLPEPAGITSVTSGPLGDAASEPVVASDVPRAAVGVSLTILAAAAAMVGAYFVVESFHDAGVADDVRAPMSPSACAGAATTSACAALSDAVDAQHRDARIGAVALGGAGAFALGAIATWFLWRPRPDRVDAAWSIAPSLAPGVATLGLGRSF